MSAEKVIETQTALVEKLKLLHEMNYSDIVEMPYHFVRTRHSNTKADIRALDIIAVCLATGRVGDVVAAAFEF